MAGKFEIFKDKGGKFRFRLKAGNGEIILSSQGYASMSSCTNGIASVKRNSSDDSRYAKKSSASGNHSFNLLAGNNQVVGTSQSYKSTSGRDNGIKSVAKSAPDAAVDDLT